MNTDVARRRADAASSAETWLLRLYTAGKNWRSEVILSRLAGLCEKHLAGRYQIEWVDLRETPALAHADNIVAVPAVKRMRPGPIMQVVGDLSNSERAVRGLGFVSAAPRPW